MPAIILFLLGAWAVRQQKAAPQLYDYVPASEPLLTEILEA